MNKEVIKNEEKDIALEACIRGKPDVAEDILRSRPQDDPRIIFNLGWHEMRHGNLSKGSSMLDAGRFINCYGSNKLQDYPIWDGISRDGQIIILRSEGGYGDEIINARFATVLAERGNKVILASHPSLMSLFSRIKGVSACVSNAAVATKLVQADYWCPAMSAVGLLKIEYATLPNSPYLNTKEELKSKFSKIIKGKIKIGLRWKGSPKFEHQQFRTFDPKPLFDIANKYTEANYFSLQKDEGQELLPVESNIIDLSSLLDTWEDTAAAIANLDLVITSCTSIAHLAGALGIPTWVIVPVMPYYIWTYPWGGDTSPWYTDNVRVFRQENFDSWSEPFEKIDIQLAQLIKNRFVKKG